MNFWVRENASPPFHGPFTLDEVAAALASGRFSSHCELLPAEGQSFGQLKKSGDWKSVKEFNLIKPPDEKTHDDREKSSAGNPSSVFISYRREDSQDVTGRIYDRLVENFSPERVFKDVDNIPLGVDFRTVLDDAIGRSAVVLVIIGPEWLSGAGEVHRRLDSPADFVRLEVEMAVKLNLPLIPVLVGEARMPSPDELPESLKSLPYKNGMAVRPDPDFNHDMERLVSSLEHWLNRSTSTQKSRINQAIVDLAREKVVERIDREWAEEREKYLVTVMKGQTWVDGQLTGGHPVREVPTRAGSIVGGIFACAIGIMFSVIGGSVLGALVGPGFGILFGLIGIFIAVFFVMKSIQAFNSVSQYELAERAYLKRREMALNGGRLEK
jgi:hypothetical protein